MNIRNSLLMLSLLAAAAGVCANPEADIREIPERAGGVYYAYPTTEDSIQPVPEGYVPVYISHYGRHGSRWMLNEKVYKVVREVLAEQNRRGNLTPFGESLIPMVEAGAKHTEGHLGELSPLGERQHRAIAGRMYKRFKPLFDSSECVEARSSQVPRCIVSMAAFTEQLRDCNPQLTVNRHVTPSDMDILVPETPESKAAGSDTSKWRRKFNHKRDSLTTSMATARKIFKSPEKVKNLPEFMRFLNDVAISVQDVDGLNIDVLPAFTPEDNADHWKSSNYIMYVRHAMSSVSDSAGAKAAAPLLRDFVECADKALSDGKPHVDLRFGHDSSLIRLISLMGVMLDEEVDDSDDATPEAVAQFWQTYRITPMAANLQLIFYRNGKGDVVVAPRYNEMPAYLKDVQAIEGYPGCYRWEDVSRKWTAASHKFLRNEP